MKKILLACLLIGPILAFFKVSWNQHDFHSAGIAPSAPSNREAIIQIYSARENRWMGILSTHSWIAFKKPFAKTYTIYHIEDNKKGGDYLEEIYGKPDMHWYGNAPELLFEMRGVKAEAVIDQIIAVAPEYPYRDKFEFIPGPNSNTFVAYMARRIPALKFRMPEIAIGKDYLSDGQYFTRTPSDTGWSFNMGGYFGVSYADVEGFELSVGGLVFGYDPATSSIKLPGIGTFSFGGAAKTPPLDQNG